MKANHNYEKINKYHSLVVVNISSSKNESKSQPELEKIICSSCCCKYQ